MTVQDLGLGVIGGREWALAQAAEGALHQFRDPHSNSHYPGELPGVLSELLERKVRSPGGQGAVIHPRFAAQPPAL